jgi:hypothetical protein
MTLKFYAQLTDFFVLLIDFTHHCTDWFYHTIALSDFYLHLQDVGNRVTLMTLMSHFYVTILPYVEFRFGTPNMDPQYDPQFGTLIWDPDLGPRFGTPIWDPDLGPRFGPTIWTPNMDPLFYSTTLLIAL